MGEKYDQDGFIVLEEAYPGALEARVYEMRINCLSCLMADAGCKHIPHRYPPIDTSPKRKMADNADDWKFTEDDYEPGKLKINIGDSIEIVRPRNRPKKKIRSLWDLIPKVTGSTFELGRGGFEWKIYYE